MNINAQTLMDFNGKNKSLYRKKQGFIEDSNIFASEIENYAEQQALDNKTVDQEWLERLTKKFHSHLLEAIVIKYREKKLDKLSGIIYSKSPEYF